MRRVFLSFIFIAAGTFVFSARFSRAAGPTYVGTTISEPTTWTKENSPYILKYKLLVNAKLTIEPGTVVKFSQGTGIETRAEIFAVGAKNEKIIFTSIHDDSAGGNSDEASERDPKWGDWDMINVSPYYDAKFENVSVSYATTGIYSQSTVSQYENLEIKNSQIKNNITGIDILNLSPIIESNVIAGNYTGISTKLQAAYPERITKIRYNSITGNNTGIFTSNTFALTPPTVDAKENWWGDDTGPYNNLKNKEGTGDKVSDYWIAFDPWLKVDPFVGLDPVIIIPGIMGSWEVDGKWKIDPIFHTYDNLRDEFLANGYEDGEDEVDGGNFFTFPYQWRDSNIDNAKLLAKKIENIKEKIGRPKVDIVAHSMGGLIAREYIESDYFAGDVDQLITVGTPQLGAPKDYIKWEAGAFFSDIFETAGKYFFKQEAKENNYDSIFHYIRGKIPSVQELLPVYDYIYDDNGSDYDLRTGYPANYPRNEFLENLNDTEKIKALKNVKFTKIIGNPTGQRTTISGYDVVNANMGELWEYGYPHGFEISIIGDQGLRKSEGDRTVPLFSSEAIEIPDDGTIYFKSNHNDLPTDVQQDILEILTGKRPDEKIDEWKIDDILIGLVFSPVDFQIVSPSGKRLGKDFDTGGTFNKIEGAYYTGFDTKSEFITIPNPENGEYKILTQGTDEGGSFRIDITKIEENANDPDNAKESTATIRGITQLGEILETKADVGTEKVIATDVSSIRRSIEHYAELGLIVGKGKLNYYKARLKLIEALFGELEITKKKKKPVDNIRAEISLHINHLIEHIQKNVSVDIDQAATEIFIEDLNDLKSTIISN
jgi:pimeloyl-ACP methyl ester carboxylesterase